MKPSERTLTYLCVFVALLFTWFRTDAATNNVEKESKRADQVIVHSGRQVIRNGCEFDNVRAHQLRGILRQGLENRRKQFEKGLFPEEQYRIAQNETRKAIHQITIRDCDAEAMSFTLAPQPSKD